jgi:hypothetical protein
VAAYFFLALVTRLQGWTLTDLPRDLGFHGEPLWWPVLPLALAGILVSLTIRYLPGTGGRCPADGFKIAGVAMGIGAMCTVMLRLPFTSVLLATLLAADALTVMPLVIVAVVVAYVSTAWLTPAPPASADEPQTGERRSRETSDQMMSASTAIRITDHTG